MASKSTKPYNVRNTITFNPLMGKGGTHQKSNKAKRRKEKMALNKEPF